MMMGKLEMPLLLFSLFIGGLNTSMSLENSVMESSSIKTDEMMSVNESYASARNLPYLKRKNICMNDYQPLCVGRRLFRDVPIQRKPKVDSSSFDGYEIPLKENSHFQEHIRYLVASTAKQPDNSGRTSSFNIWLTILIAALAAAILS